MRFRRRFCATRALVPRYGRLRRPLGTNGWEPGIVLGQSPLDFAQVLPRVLERPPETAAGRPQVLAALDLGSADLRRDALELKVEKSPKVREPRSELAGLGAFDRPQRFLQAFRLADAGGAEVLGFGVSDVGNDVAQNSPLRGLGGELAVGEFADEGNDLLAEPLEAAAVRTLVFLRQWHEVRREARSRIA